MPDTEPNKTPKTREEYRKQQRQQEAEFTQRDKRRVEAEREYAKTHQQESPKSSEPVTNTSADYKTPGWRKTNRWLTVIIGILVVLIVIVYLLLFFVN